VQLATTSGRVAAVHLHLNPTVLDSSADQAAEVAGFGYVPASLARALAVASDLVETGYTPSARAGPPRGRRGPHLPFPGCTRTAHRCDLDHTIPWPDGPTAAANLGPLCRRHHQFKQSEGVRVEQISPGQFRWTLPTGHHYTVTPDHIDPDGFEPDG
jgi:hypothetical protein